MDQQKREFRQEKRLLKRKGNQRVRRIVRQALAEHPEDAHELEPDVGRLRTADLNGNDHDATRRKRDEPQDR
ncbi:MAG: hypothetical protein U0794_22320 [Isosphaeraceae bacterium]